MFWDLDVFELSYCWHFQVCWSYFNIFVLDITTNIFVYHEQHSGGRNKENNLANQYKISFMKEWRRKEKRKKNKQNTSVEWMELKESVFNKWFILWIANMQCTPAYLRGFELLPVNNLYVF